MPAVPDIAQLAATPEEAIPEPPSSPKTADLVETPTMPEISLVDPTAVIPAVTATPEEAIPAPPSSSQIAASAWRHMLKEQQAKPDEAVTNGLRSYVSVADISTSSNHLKTQQQYLAVIRPSDHHKFSYHGEVIGSFD
jgi:hypothetical protein